MEVEKDICMAGKECRRPAWTCLLGTGGGGQWGACGGPAGAGELRQPCLPSPPSSGAWGLKRVWWFSWRQAGGGGRGKESEVPLGTCSEAEKGALGPPADWRRVSGRLWVGLRASHRLWP